MKANLAYKVKGCRFDMGGAKFRHHIEPEEDEILSCWLVRVARSLNSDPATFVNLYLPAWKNSLWMEDVDVSAENGLIAALAYKSGSSTELVHRLTLRSYEGYLSEHITCKTTNPFIQSLGRYCRIKIKHGLRFCPLCLRDDKIAYFRRRWRLSFSTACLIHKCFLMDRCPACGASVIPYRSLRECEFDITHCYKCGIDLRTVEPEWIPEGSYGLWAIRRLYEILNTGVFTYSDGYTYSFLFFDVLRLFVRIVYFWGRDNGLMDHEVMGAALDLRDEKPRTHLIENIPLKKQYSLFSGLVRLFEGFPGRLISFCEANRFRGSDLTRDMRAIPSWYARGIVDVFNMGSHRTNSDEVASVITYLRRKGVEINKASVGRTMGISPDFKKRKDILRLF